MKTLLARAVVLLFVAFALACSNKGPKPEVQAENDAREAVGRAAVIDADGGRALAIGSRNNVLFEEGFSNVSYDPPNDFRNAAFRWMGQRGHVRLHVKGDRPMKLKVRGWLHEKVIRAKGVVTLYLNGELLYTTHAVEYEHWTVDIVVPTTMQHGPGWLDLILSVSAVAFHWSEPPALQVVVLNELEWSEMP
jgi:hypothetical protein